MATGVLVLGIGEGTKLLAHLTGADKTYLATIKLGEQTDTLDAQGQVVERRDCPGDLTFAAVERVAAEFRGAQRQRVPAISAVKQDGVRLYTRARRGEVVDAPERDVFVHELEILRVQPPEIELRVRCSKGYYVRALARDLALRLGTLGHLTQLRRTQSGQFTLADAAPGELLEIAPQKGQEGQKGQKGQEGRNAKSELMKYLLPMAAALRECAQCVLNDGGLREIHYGRPVRPEHWSRLDPVVPGQQPVALIDERGELRALGRAEPDRVVIIRGMSTA
jgi:tRNA pseudouridine55 synthase